MKCDLILHDVDDIVLPNIQILATLLVHLGINKSLVSRQGLSVKLPRPTVDSFRPGCTR